MAKTKEQEQETPQGFPSIEQVEAPPQGVGFRRRSENVDQLISLIQDKQWHVMKDIDVDDKEFWARKLRYAARLAGMELETKYLPNHDPAGLYFLGHDPGTAPPRGRRAKRDE